MDMREALTEWARQYKIPAPAFEALLCVVAERGTHSIAGELVEMGNDDEGIPRLLIRTTQEAVRDCRASLLYRPVVVTLANPNP